MAEGVTHISLPTQEYDRGRQEKIERQTNKQSLGLTKSRGRYCNTTCMCGLSLAWVTSENSTMLLESDILRLFFTGPYLVSSPLCSVSGVDCPSVLPRQLLLFPLSCPVSTALRGLQPQLPFLCSPATNCLSWSPATNSFCSCPTTNCLSLVLASLYWVASSTLIRLPVPLPGTARFHVQESFVWFRAKTDN